MFQNIRLENFWGDSGTGMGACIDDRGIEEVLKLIIIRGFGDQLIGILLI